MSERGRTLPGTKASGIRKTRRYRVALPGDRFGRLVVLKIDPPRHRIVQCDCGSPPFRILAYGLRERKTQHCGCVINKDRYTIPHRAHPLVRFLYRQLNIQGATVEEAAERAGLCKQVFRDWRRKCNPTLDNILAAGGALGFHLVWMESEN